MNYRAIAHYAGHVLKAEAMFMLIPLIFSIYDREYKVVSGFLITIALTIAFSLVLEFLKRGYKNINAKDGFVLVSVCWILLSFFGALPYWFSGELTSFGDCMFESVSGFTTTGASVLTSVEGLDKGLLFWRSFTNWIGGMGILMFLLAIVSSSSGEHAILVLKAETPGPSPSKLVPNLKQSAKILYGIYVGLTLIQTLFYLVGGMPLFDSVCNAFSTAGTGGLSIWSASIGHYNNLYFEIITTIFMILFGLNFSLYYLLLVRKFKSFMKSEELKAYITVILVATAVITVNLTGTVHDTIGSALRYASFTVASIITTTGFSVADFNQWPELSKTIILMLMFTGACGGSTSGGLKISRILIGLKEAKRVLFRISHPRSYEVIKMDGKVLDKNVVYGVNTYFVTFAMIFSASLLLLSIDNHDFATTFSALASCVNNVGPGFDLVGPAANYEFFSGFGKLVLAVNMLIGRLEIYPMLLLFAPHTWRKL